MNYQFEMLIKVIYPDLSIILSAEKQAELTLMEYAHLINRGDGTITADEYYDSRYEYLAKKEQVCTILARQGRSSLGMEPLYAILPLMDSSEYVRGEWVGQRRGTYYRFVVYVFVTQKEAWTEYVAEATRLLKESGILDIRKYEQDVIYGFNNDLVHSFYSDDIFINNFVDTDHVHKGLYFEHVEADEIAIIEKNTRGITWVNWDREVPPEGDWIEPAIAIISIIGGICRYIAERRKLFGIRSEKKLVRKYRNMIIGDYPIRGHLERRHVDAVNSSGERIYVFEDRCGDALYSVYEIEKKSGEIRRIKCS